MLNRLRGELEEIGFTSKESGVYLTLLEHGALGAHQISRLSNVNRSTVYLALESLIERGVVSCSDDKGARCFAAESPMQIERILKEEQQRHLQASKQIESSMPQLFALWNAIESKPSVRYFEGEEGVDRCREYMLQIAKGEQAGAAFIHYNEDMVRAAKQNEAQRLRFSSGRLRLRVLYRLDDGLEIPIFGKNVELREIPDSIPEFKGEINVFSDFVLLAFHSPLTTLVVIENRSLADMFMASFDLAWEGAK